MKRNRFANEMLERGIKGYDATFISGCIAFALAYFISKSFLTAITFAAVLWTLSLFIFICYYFEIGTDYYTEVKKISNPKGNKYLNLTFSVLGVFIFTLTPLALIALVFFVTSLFIK